MMRCTQNKFTIFFIGLLSLLGRVGSQKSDPCPTLTYLGPTVDEPDSGTPLPNENAGYGTIVPGPYRRIVQSVAGIHCTAHVHTVYVQWEIGRRDRSAHGRGRNAVGRMFDNVTFVCISTRAALALALGGRHGSWSGERLAVTG